VRWQLRAADSTAIAQLSQEARLAPVLARLLVARGIGDAEAVARFLTPTLEHLHSPYAMRGMKAAVERLAAALERQERILIYGDYDVDGTTAIVILKAAIELCGGAADFHVPHRIREGYGMKDEVIERAAAEGVRLIISVDTGIRAFAAAETAHRAGVDLIVTDHHLPNVDEGVPRALAVLNPNQAGCEYPCKALCGAGVAFKLAQALLEKNGRARLIPSFLKMVVIATIADVVPLVGENRVFAKLGLEGLRQPVNVGLRALLEVAQLDGKALSASDVGFRLAPRLNAAGRMDVARDVIELFSVRDAARAREIAQRLDRLNAERQQEEARILEQIEERFAAAPEWRDAYCIVVDGDGWHRGVIGITATRVVERYGRPALVISVEEGEGHGSGRSIAAFHLLDALESCRELFTRYGGHAHAAGFALPAERIPELRAALDAYARARLGPADFVPLLELDAELELDSVTPELFETVCQLEPFGCDNPEPVFAARGVRLLLPPKVLKDKHVKLRVAQNLPGGRRGRVFDALGWRLAERLQQESVLSGDLLDVAFTIEHNPHPEWGGLELRLEDFAKAQASAAAPAP
jgi:single-stranded-DNA-specific exonuclease